MNNEITVITVRPRFVYIIDSRLKHKTMKNIEIKILTGLFTLCNKLKLLLSYATWPLISPLYSNRLFAVAYKICKENEIDVIIPIYTQIDAIIAAKRIKKKMPMIKYIPYFLDSLSGGYGPRVFSPEWTVRRGIKWERRLLPTADKIICMNSSKKHHEMYSSQTSYYEKMLFLDLPLLRPCKLPQARIISDKIFIFYIGSLPLGIRSPEYFLKVFFEIHNYDFQLYFVGTENCKILNEYANKDKRIHVLGRCSHEQALKYEAQADIFLNIGNSNTRMTPSKIFEYMSSGKAIISTCPIKDEPSIDYLKKYPLSFFLYENEQNLLLVSKYMTDFILKNFYKRVKYADIRNTFFNNTPEAFADSLWK